MWSNAPFGIKNDIDANHSFLTYFDVLFAVLIKLGVVIKALLYLILPVTALCSILILYNIFGSQWYDLLKSNDEQIW